MKLKRLLAFLLAFVMMFSLTTPAYAEGGGDDEYTEEAGEISKVNEDEELTSADDRIAPADELQGDGELEEDDGTRTITIAIASWWLNPQVQAHYWVDGIIGDVDLEATGQSVYTDINGHHPSGETKQYFLYTAEIPVNAQFKLHAGDTWFGLEDSSATDTYAFLFDHGKDESGNPINHVNYERVDYSVEIGETYYQSAEYALTYAQDGETITLLKDIEIDTGNRLNDTGDNTRFPIKRSITIDGDDYTISINNRGFGVGVGASSKIDVTFKNVTIENKSSGARCIDTRGNIGTLTLDGVTLKTDGAASGYTQPLTIGGNQSDPATINISNSTIQTNEAGTAYYAVTTFNPVNMTITDSTLKGWACIYAKGVNGSAGSAGSVFTITGSTLVSTNEYNGTSNAFAMFTAEDNNVTFNVTDSDITVNANSDQKQALVSADSKDGVVCNLGSGNNVTLTGENATFALNQGDCNITGGTFNMPVPEEVCAAGYIPKDNGDGTYTVKSGHYVAQVGEAKFESFAEAAAAANGKTITLLDDAGSFTLAVGQTLKVQLNGYALTINAPGGYFVDPVEEEGVTTYTPVAIVAKIGETSYASLQAAVAAAHEMTGDVTVTLYADTQEVVVIHQKAGLNLTVDGGNNTLTGQIHIDGDGRSTGTDTLTIRNFAFVYDPETYEDGFINLPNTIVPDTNYYTNKNNNAHNITVEGCTFAGEVGVTVAFCFGMTGSTKNITLRDLNAENMKSLTEMTGVDTVTVENCTLENAQNGIVLTGASGTITVSGNNLQATGTAFQMKGASAATATLSGNSFGGTNCVVLDTSKNGKVLINGGEYAGKIESKSNGSITISGGFFTEAPKLAYCAEGLYPVASGRTDEFLYTLGATVALVNGVGYPSVADAKDARGTNDDVITLVQNAEYAFVAGDVLKVAKANDQIEFIYTVQEGYTVLESEADDGVITYTAAPIVAKIGETPYASLQAAVAAVPADGTETTITMIDNVVIDVEGTGILVPLEKNIVLDLNGKTITGNNNEETTSALIYNLGTLTIKDSGENGKIEYKPTNCWVYSEANPGGYASNLIRNNGTLVISGGTLYNEGSGSAAYAIDSYNSGKVTVNGGAIDANKASAIRLFYNNGGALAITGGTVGGESNYMGIQVMSGSNVAITVTGGTISGTYALYSNSTGTSKANISGGSFSGYVGFAAAYADTIAISGGEFDSWVGTWGSHAGFISGGLFAEAPDVEYCAEGLYPIANTDPETKEEYPYTVGGAVALVNEIGYQSVAEAKGARGTENDVITLVQSADYAFVEGDVLKIAKANDQIEFTYTVADGFVLTVSEPDDNGVVTYTVVTPVAKIGDVKFATLADAFEAAQNDDTIEMIADAVVANSIEIAGKKVTLDLAGKNITSNADDTIHVLADGELVFMDSVGSGSMVTNNNTAINNEGTTTIESGAIKATNGHGGPAVYNEGTMTVNGGSIVAEGNFINAFNADGADSVTVINGGTITMLGDSGVAINSTSGATIEIKGGTIVAEGNETAILQTMSGGNINMSGGTIEAQGDGQVAVVMAESGNGKITLSGSTWEINHNTNEETALFFKLNGSGTLEITGGYYTDDPSAYVDQTKYAVVKQTINDKEWYTLGEAVATRSYTVEGQDEPVVIGYTSLEAAFASKSTRTSRWI